MVRREGADEEVSKRSADKYGEVFGSVMALIVAAPFIIMLWSWAIECAAKAWRAIHGAP